MTHVLTVIAPPGTSTLEGRFPQTLSSVLERAGAQVGDFEWLAPNEAGDLPFAGLVPARAVALARAALPDQPFDLAAQPREKRRKELFLADMESTIIAEEMLDRMAERVGIAEEVSDITRRAMAGELDFEEALRARVSLMAGQPAQILEELAEQMTLNPGALTLLRTLRRHGVHCVLVSGGFSIFANRIRKTCGFDDSRSNHIIIEKDRIRGDLSEPILDGRAKAAILREICHQRDLEPLQAAAVGDGANDLLMLQAAGLGVSYRGKPILRRNAPFCVDHGDLTALLYLQGYPRDDFVTRP